jgi:hypothetical protein
METYFHLLSLPWNVPYQLENCYWIIKSYLEADLGKEKFLDEVQSNWQRDRETFSSNWTVNWTVTECLNLIPVLGMETIPVCF